MVVADRGFSTPAGPRRSTPEAGQVNDYHRWHSCNVSQTCSMVETVLKLLMSPICRGRDQQVMDQHNGLEVAGPGDAHLVFLIAFVRRIPYDCTVVVFLMHLRQPNSNLPNAVLYTRASRTPDVVRLGPNSQKETRFVVKRTTLDIRSGTRLQKGRKARRYGIEWIVDH